MLNARNCRIDKSMKPILFLNKIERASPSLRANCLVRYPISLSASYVVQFAYNPSYSLKVRCDSTLSVSEMKNFRESCYPEFEYDKITWNRRNTRIQLPGIVRCSYSVLETRFT